MNNWLGVDVGSVSVKLAKIDEDENLVDCYRTHNFTNFWRAIL